MAKSRRSKSGMKKRAKSTSRAKSTPRRKRLNLGPVIYLGVMVVVMFGLAMAVYYGS